MPRLAASRTGAAPILVDVGGTARTAQGY